MEQYHPGHFAQRYHNSKRQRVKLHEPDISFRIILDPGRRIFASAYMLKEELNTTAAEPHPTLSIFTILVTQHSSYHPQNEHALYRHSDRFSVLSERLMEEWHSRLWKEEGRK